MTDDIFAQCMSSRIRLLAIQSTPPASCWPRSWWAIFRWEMESFTWFIVRWWWWIRQSPSSSRYVTMWHFDFLPLIFQMKRKVIIFRFANRSRSFTFWVRWRCWMWAFTAFSFTFEESDECKGNIFLLYLPCWAFILIWKLLMLLSMSAFKSYVIEQLKMKAQLSPRTQCANCVP